MSDARRTFIRSAATGAAALALAPYEKLLAAAATQHDVASTTRAAAPLNILVLGGTGFTGPQQVNYALERGHRITLLNRNRRRPDMFKGKVEMIVGDLNGDVSALAGKKFDVVIDNPTTDPAWVRNVAQHLKGQVGHYIFISTISVYPDFKQPGKLETAALTPMPAGVDPYKVPPAERGKYYGALKTFSEQEVERQYSGRATIIRPGLIVGPLDTSDRFTYWPMRIDQGGDVLAPGTGNDAVQIIDARDLAEWTVRVAEQKVLGVYNAVGPQRRLSMAEMLYGIKAITTAGAQFHWAPLEFLQAEKISPWTNMPVWESPVGDNAFASDVSNARAVAAGLTYRTLADTARDTLAWQKSRPAAEQLLLTEARRFGITREREAAAVAKLMAGR